MGCDRLSYEELGLGILRNVTLLPQKPTETLCLWTCHHHFHLLQSLGLQALCLLSLISGLPPIGCLPFSVDPATKRWKSTEVETSGPVDYLGGRWEMVCDKTFLWGGGAGDTEECNIAPLRSPQKPSASEHATITSIFSNPSASKHCASVSNFWASSCRVPAFFQ